MSDIVTHYLRSGSTIDGLGARPSRHRLGRFKRRPILEPLFKQQRRRRTVESTGSITLQTMAFSSRPSAAVLIHPSQGKPQGLG
jgi:hypothetical protein